MPLGWNEIKDRALKFSREWAEEASEDAEAKSFRDGFFAAVKVFGPMRNGAAFMAKPVERLDQTQRNLIAQALAVRYPEIQ
jgi:hypothetical protein